MNSTALITAPITFLPNTTKGNSTLKHALYFLVLNDIATAEMIIILLFNISLSFFLLSTKSLRKQQSVKLFINLQLVHILLAVIFLARLYGEDHHTDTTTVYFSNGLLVEMFVCLQVCTMDRFVAIKFPYLYKRIQSNYTNILVMIMWTLALVFTITAIVCQATDYQMYVIRNSLILSATIVLVSSNVMVYIVAEKHHQAMSRLCVHDQASRNQGEKMLKSTYVCLCIVSSFIVLWLPLFVHNFLYLHFPAKLDKDDENFTYIVEIIAVFNSVLDPILFVAFRKDVKKSLKARSGMMNRHDTEAVLPNISDVNNNNKSVHKLLKNSALNA